MCECVWVSLLLSLFFCFQSLTLKKFKVQDHEYVCACVCARVCMCVCVSLASDSSETTEVIIIKLVGHFYMTMTVTFKTFTWLDQLVLSNITLVSVNRHKIIHIETLT